jgi:hypothetical protein
LGWDGWGRPVCQTEGRDEDNKRRGGRKEQREALFGYARHFAGEGSSLWIEFKAFNA